jgi:hypothetical protein
MISYHEYQRMDRWVQRARRQSYQDVQRQRRQRLREAQRAAHHETPVIAALGWLHVVNAWFSTVVAPQFRAAGRIVAAAPVRPAARLLPDTGVRQR